MNQETDEGNYKNEDQRDGIEVEGNFGAEIGDRDPGPEVLRPGGTRGAGKGRGEELGSGNDGEESGEADGGTAEPGGVPAGEARAEEREHGSARRGEGRGEAEGGLHNRQW